MRKVAFGVGMLVLAAQIVPAAAAHKQAPITEWSARRGFSWFFAHNRPDGRCGGRSVVATWYSQGRRAASGQPFNPHGLTAAHRTLPFGSQVTVTNPKNGRSVAVTINDRGPFTRGVTIDLARGAAMAIGMTGTQHVCMS